MLPLSAPIAASENPTLVSDLIPNAVVLAAPGTGTAWLGASGWQGPVAHTYAVVDTLPTGVLLALLLPNALVLTTGVPEARLCPIASPVAEATVTWFVPGVTRVAVTEMRG